MVDCRGVYDAWARSSSSCLGLKDKESGLAALALKRSLARVRHDDTLVSFRGTAGRCCNKRLCTQHVLFANCSFAVVFWWKLIHDPKIESSRNRAKRGIDILEQPDEDEFAASVPRDPKSVTLFT